MRKSIIAIVESHKKLRRPCVERVCVVRVTEATCVPCVPRACGCQAGRKTARRTFVLGCRRTLVAFGSTPMPKYRHGRPPPPPVRRQGDGRGVVAAGSHLRGRPNSRLASKVGSGVGIDHRHFLGACFFVFRQEAMNVCRSEECREIVSSIKAVRCSSSS